MNFIDGVGLSAQWSPEFGFDWLRGGEQQQQQHQHNQHEEPRRHSCEPEVTHSPEPEEIGTPFSTWLPSAPADDQVHLRSYAGDGTYRHFQFSDLYYHLIIEFVVMSDQQGRSHISERTCGSSPQDIFHSSQHPTHHLGGIQRRSC